MDGHRTAERRSLAFHRAIAERLGTEPGVLMRARARVDEWCATGGVHPRHAGAWKELLERSGPEIAAALVEETEYMTALRQVSPFAGALDARTRWQLWRSAG